MPARPSVRFTSALVHRPRPQAVVLRPWQQVCLAQRRCFADAKGSTQEEIHGRLTSHIEGDGEKGPNMDQMPHVSEEAAATSKVMGEKGPQVEQGTPVQEMVKPDDEAFDSLPKVMQDAIKNKKPSGSRSFSTYTRRRLEVQSNSFSGSLETIPQAFSLQNQAQEEAQSMQLEAQGAQDDVFDPLFDNTLLGSVPPQPTAGLRYAPVTLPLSRQMHMKHRYDPVVEQVTKLIMKDGKLSIAQRHMAEVLTHLRTSPAPSARADRPLIPGSPPPAHLPLHPTLYLTVAIDSVAPILRLRSQRGAAGGGVALQIPIPLGLRQRRRQAIMWMVDAVDKRAGGTSGFAKRLAEEVIAVVEGRSGVWARRQEVHRLAVAARANLNALVKRK